MLRLLHLYPALFYVFSSPTHSAGYITSGLPGHVHRAWLKEMTVEVCDTTPGQLTEEMCYKAPQLLSAWAQNPYIPHKYAGLDTFPHHGKECAILCERLLKRIVDERRAGNPNAVPNTQTYNSLIDVWSRSGERGAAAQRAEQILIGMQDAYTSGEVDVQPDLESFRLVLRAWAQAKGETDAPYRAQALLEWMVRLHESGENELVQPDADCFDVVLGAWAQSGHNDAPYNTEELIMFMERMYKGGNAKVKPTRTSFNHVLNAWSNSGSSRFVAKRSEDILSFMLTLSKQPGNEDLLPNSATYASVITAWSKARLEESGRRADRVLQQMEDQFMKSDNDLFMAPDTIMYNLVIDAHAKTQSTKAHRRARAVLDRQINLYTSYGVKRCRPDVYSFTSVLSSCASLGTTSKRKRLHAFEVARGTFVDMCRWKVSPNHVTYGTMLKACSRLLPKGKDQRRYTREYFRRACDDGCVGEMVLNHLKGAASPVQYKGLMKGLTKSTLPPQWTSRVPDREKYERKYAVNGQKRHDIRRV